MVKATGRKQACEMPLAAPAALVGTEFSRIGEGTPKDAHLSYLRYGLWSIFITVFTALFWFTFVLWAQEAICDHRHACHHLSTGCPYLVEQVIAQIAAGAGDAQQATFRKVCIWAWSSLTNDFSFAFISAPALLYIV